MKAVLCKAFGPPESLVLEEVDAPTAGPGQVLIDVHASAVNFPDVLMIEGKYQNRPPFPFSPGGEIAGVIEAIGEGVDGFTVGDRVLGMTGHYSDELAHRMLEAGAETLLQKPFSTDAVIAACGFAAVTPNE